MTSAPFANLVEWKIWKRCTSHNQKGHFPHKKKNVDQIFGLKSSSRLKTSKWSQGGVYDNCAPALCKIARILGKASVAVIAMWTLVTTPPPFFRISADAGVHKFLIGRAVMSNLLACILACISERQNNMMQASRKCFLLALAWENSHFSSLLAACDVSREGTSATQRQKFHTDDVNQC